MRARSTCNPDASEPSGPLAPRSALSALSLLARVWCLLLAAAWLPIPRELAVLAGFLTVTALVGRRLDRRELRRIRPAADLALLFAGLAIHPGLCRLIGALGLLLGLAVPPPDVAPTSVALAFSTLVLAPLFEELLYRQELLLSIERVAGKPAAALISSALFSLGHVRPWPMLGSFVAGLLLASVRQRSRRLSACVALHAGFNLSAFLRPATLAAGLAWPGP